MNTNQPTPTKAMNTNELTNVATEFFMRICAAYDLTELGRTGSRTLKDNCVELEGQVTPKGQLACICDSLEVTLRLSVKDQGAVVALGVVKFSYKHVGGGSNGFDVRYIVTMKKSYGAALKYASHVRECDFFEASQALRDTEKSI